MLRGRRGYRSSFLLANMAVGVLETSGTAAAGGEGSRNTFCFCEASLRRNQYCFYGGSFQVREGLTRLDSTALDSRVSLRME